MGLSKTIWLNLVRLGDDGRFGSALASIADRFAVHDHEGFLKALETAIPVNLSRINEGLVILEQKNISPDER